MPTLFQKDFMLLEIGIQEPSLVVLALVSCNGTKRTNGGYYKLALIKKTTEAQRAKSFCFQLLCDLCASVVF